MDLRKTKAVLLGLSLSLTSYAQTYELLDNWWLPAGDVNTIAVDSAHDLVYVGGRFRYVGPQTNQFAVVLESSSTQPYNIGESPNDRVDVALPDNDGWYIGGVFSNYGDSSRMRLAHVDTSGVVTAKLRNIGCNGLVTSMDRLGDTLFVGGLFSSCGDMERFRKYSAVVDQSSASPNLSFPEANGNVWASAPDGSGGWYLGGAFTEIGGVSRQYIAHVNSSGTVTSWNPSPNDVVRTIEPYGSNVFIGGDFTLMGDSARNYIAAVHASTGAIQPWNPDANNTVEVIVIDNDTAFIGGHFENIGGQTRNHIACVPVNSNSATSWNPNANKEVYDIELDGDYLFAGGKFYSVGGQTRKGVVKINRNSGAVQSWFPNVYGGPSTVFDLDIAGDTVVIGGEFDYVGSSERASLAAINKNNAQVYAWNPDLSLSYSNIDPVVYALFIKNGHAYIGGGFRTVGDDLRHGAAAISLSTGLVNSWDPNPNEGVYTLSQSGSSVFMGGVFTAGCGPARHNLAAIDLNTETLLNWSVHTNGIVEDVKVINDVVFFGGRFDTIGTTARNNLASVNRVSGALTTWNPNPDDAVTRLALMGDTLIVGGYFEQMGTTARNSLAAFTASSSTPLSWNPNANGGFLGVRAITVAGERVYIAGTFSNFNGQSAYDYLVAVNRGSGAVISWDPNVNGTIFTVEEEGNEVFIGGFFEQVGNSERHKFAVVNRNSAAVNSNYQHFGHIVSEISLAHGRAFCGGHFASFGGQPQLNLAALDMNTGELASWNSHGAANHVNDMVLHDSTLYVGGLFSSIGGANHGRLAAFNTNTGQVSSWDPEPDNEVYCLEYHNDTLYVGGKFDEISGQTRNYVAAYNASTLALTAWNPDASDYVFDIAATDNAIYVGGGFQTIGGQSPEYIGKISPTTGNALSWDAGNAGGGRVQAVEVVGNSLYIGGDFTYMGNTNRYGFAELNASNASLDGWDPNPRHLSWNDLYSGEVFRIKQYGTSTYVIGNFEMFDKTMRTSVVGFNTANNEVTALDLDIPKTAKDFVMFEDMVFVGMDDPNRTQGLRVYQNTNTCSTAYETVSVTECDTFTWSLNNVTYTASGTYSEVLTGASGCDSVVTLDLTLTAATAGTQTTTECTSYFWPATGQSYTNSGTYTATLINSNGCDSIATLSLTIVQPTYGGVNAHICQGDSFLVGGEYVYTSGVYHDTLTNAAGCDSVRTIFLSVHAYSKNVQVHLCAGESYYAGGAFQDQPGVYYDTLTSQLGCDSVINTLITVESINTNLTLAGTTITSLETQALAYQWAHCTGYTLISGATQVSYTPTVTGDYLVIIEKNGCNDTSECVSVVIETDTTDSTIGIAALESGMVSLFPNPTAGSFTLTFDQLGNYSVSIYTMMGQLLYATPVTDQEQVQMDVPGPAGSYIVRVDAADRSQRFVLIKR